MHPFSVFISLSGKFHKKAFVPKEKFNLAGKLGNGREYMKKRMEKQGSTLIVRLPGELDHHAAAKIREEADRYLHAGTLSEIVFDFSETEFMDSSGIGMLMGRYRMIHLMGGKVSARHLQRQVHRIFQMSGLEKIIEIIQE